ncbi:tetratricopeptide repeat protein, partial [bacterium]|nr:tetratricopeptide repeat protein [bacterium]
MHTITNPIVNDYISKAKDLIKENSFKDAISFYLNAILADRTNPKAYFELGLCYKNIKNYEKAIQAFKNAARLDKYYY